MTATSFSTEPKSPAMPQLSGTMDRPDGAIIRRLQTRFALPIFQDGTTRSRRDVMDYVRSVVGAYVYFGRQAERRYVVEEVIAR